MDPVPARTSSKAIPADSALPRQNSSKPLLPRQTSSAIIRTTEKLKQAMELKTQMEDTGKKVQVDEKPGKKGKKKGKDKVKDAIASSENFRNMDEHKIPIETLFERLGLEDPRMGLSKEFAKQRLAAEGPNQLTQAKPTPWYVLFFKQLIGLFQLLLWLGAVLCFIAYGLTPDDKSNLWLGIVIVCVVLFIALFAFYQESKSRAILAGFKNFTPPKCLVIRDGGSTTIAAAELVRGDIVQLKSGDRIPADLRIVTSNDMKVENAALTGESEHLPRKPECSRPDNPFETQNLTFFGTMCVDGGGTGIVINVGDSTFMGRIAHLAETAESDETTLAKEIGKFIKLIAGVAIVIGIIFFVLGMAYGYGAIASLIFMIGIIVANVPEGLLATVTVGLTLTAQRMAKKNVLVKNLESVETLGSTTCICSDKTGTLTQNIMTVVEIWYDCEVKKVPELKEFYSPGYKHETAPSYHVLNHCAVCCSDAVFDKGVPPSLSLNEGEKKGLSEEQLEQRLQQKREKYIEDLLKKPFYEWPTTSNASEGALIKYFQSVEALEVTRANQPIVERNGVKVSIPFNSTNKYQVSVHCPAVWQPPEHRSDCVVFMKGAPEIVLKRCTHYMRDGAEFLLDGEWQDSFNKANQHFGNQGERVLGFALKFLPASTYPLDGYDWKVAPVNFPLEGLTFIGLAALQDPPRPGVPEAVLSCQSAGIKVIMVTGDQPVTAAAIGRQCNIITHKTANELALERKLSSWEDCLDECEAVVIHGDELNRATAEDEELPKEKQGLRLLRWLSKKEIVFARTTPAQKLIIVEGNQNFGHIVAVTGDGVNDSPAIKKADIGIAMNIVGSDVAKDAADMLLLDDNFVSIVHAVEEGRLIFDNLKKSIIYTLASNIPELGPFLSFIAFMIPLPLTTILILFVDLGSDMVPAVSMAYEEAELNIMQRQPRNADVDHLVTWKLLAYGYAELGIIEMMAGFYVYFLVMYDYGFTPDVLIGISLDDKGAKPSKDDVYIAHALHKGNTRWNDPDADGELPNWLTDDDADYDMRLWYYKSSMWSHCEYDHDSGVLDGVRVCYSTDALKYGQTAFLLAIIATQWANMICCKTRMLSIKDQGMHNRVGLIGLISETVVGILVSYLPGLNEGILTRPLKPLHLFMPAMPFAIMMIIYEETRKFLMRSSSDLERKYVGTIEKLSLW